MAARRKESGGERVKVGIWYLDHYRGLPPIRRMTGGSSGFDIHAACEADIVIEPGAVALIPAGLVLSIPEGYEAQVRPRSGLALKSRLGLLNAPGTIDSDYRGEVSVIMYNFGEDSFTVKRGDRVAQLVFCRVPAVELVEMEAVDGTERGPGGFGHTG
jgi:dUTP diphosphatase